MKPSRMTRALGWVLLYLWSVPLAWWISDAFDLAYDGVGVWWLVAAYTLPVSLLFEPFNAQGREILHVCYFVLLSLASIWFMWRLYRSRMSS